MKPMHSGHIRHALVRHIGWYSNLLMPEFELDGGLCDLVQITRSGYATEYEIKVSRADWKADAAKDKWRRERPHIARFFYVVPESIAEFQPEWTPAGAGLLVAVRRNDLGWIQIRELRAAKRFSARKLSEHTIKRVHEAAYYRYWRDVQDRDARRLYSEDRAAA